MTVGEWSKEKISELRALVKTHTWQQIAAHFGVGERSLRKKAKELGVRKYILNKADSGKDLRVNRFSEEHGVRKASEYYKMTVDEVKNSRKRVRAKRERINQVFTQKRFEKFRGKCYAVAQSLDFDHEAEDFASWAMVATLEGRNSTIENLAKDYMDWRRPFLWSETIKEEEDPEEPGVILVAPMPPDTGGKLFAMADHLQLTFQERLIFLLHYREGMEMAEIAMYFGVTHSRVSQILTVIRALLIKNAETKAMLTE